MAIRADSVRRWGGAAASGRGRRDVCGRALRGCARSRSFREGPGRRGRARVGRRGVAAACGQPRRICAVHW
eukprot:8919756-Lingulodinium_polyedra.AAC.1